MDVFGAPPKPIAYVVAIRQLYPWCDFPRLGIGPLFGRLRADSLVLDVDGAVPCFYQFPTPIEVVTTVSVHIVGIR